MNIIGIRKMIVIVWCSLCITCIEVSHILWCEPSSPVTLTICTLIAGLGGFHVYRQGVIDKAKINEGG